MRSRLETGHSKAASSRGVGRLWRRVELSLRRLVRRRPRVCLVALTLALLLPGMASLPLLDRDEPRFARAAVEMRESGDWIVPTFNGEPRLHKPPLTYWCQSLSCALLGESELGVRLHSALAACGVALLVFRMAREELGRRVALRAALVWSSLLQVWLHGRLALADMLLVFFVTLAMEALRTALRAAGQDRRRAGRAALDGALAAAAQADGARADGSLSGRERAERTRADRARSLALYGAIGLGFLAKGPLAFLIPLLALALARWLFERRPLPSLASLHPRSGWLLSLALVAAWGVPALIETSGRFWQEGIGKHVVERGLAPMNGRGVLPLYYLASAFVSLWPWTPFVPAGLALAWRRRGPFLALLLGWASAPYLIFSFYATQLPHYVLPGFPALAILIALALEREPGSRLRRALSALQLALVAAGALALLAADSSPDANGVRLLAWLLLAILATWIALARQLRLERPLPFLLCLVLLGWLTTRMAQQAAELSLTRGVGEWIAREAPPGKLVGLGFREPGLVFYARRPWDFEHEPRELEALLAQRPAALLSKTGERELGQLLFPRGLLGRGAESERRIETSRPVAPDGYEQSEWRGLDFAGPRWVSLRLWIRRD